MTSHWSVFRDSFDRQTEFREWIERYNLDVGWCTSPKLIRSFPANSGGGFSRDNFEASRVSGSVSRDAVNKVPTGVGEKWAVSH